MGLEVDVIVMQKQTGRYEWSANGTAWRTSGMPLETNVYSLASMSREYHDGDELMGSFVTRKLKHRRQNC